MVKEMSTMKELPTDNSSERYWITDEGLIYRLNRELIKIDPFIKDDELWVELIVNDIKYEWRVASLIAVCFCDIKVNHKRWDKVIPLFKDECNKEIKADNLLYRFDGPLQDDLNQGFFVIPYFTTCSINKDGVIIRRYIKKPVVWSTFPSPKGKYWTTTIYNDIKGKNSFCSRHRAMCLVFNPYFKNPTKLVVNHKDGIPGNDWPSNLELVTYKQNTLHAMENNLLPHLEKPICYRNWKTGEEKRFRSIAETSRQLNIDVGLIERRTKPDKESVRYQDGRCFKYDDGRPWPKLNDYSVHAVGHRVILAYNVFTKEITEYGSQSLAEVGTGVVNGTIGQHLREKTAHPINGFFFRIKSDNPIFPDFSERHLECFRDNPNGNRRTAIAAKNFITGEELFFPSAEKACEFFKLQPGHVCKMAHRGGCIKGYVLEIFKYDDHIF
jgi:hypothetical protein